MPTIPDYLLGPAADLRRFILGAVSGPPATRRIASADLAAARAILVAAGCDLAGLTQENLHSAIVPLSPGEAYDQFAAWQAWPRSSFFPCSSTGTDGSALFAYRFYGCVPIVRMRLESAVRPRHIIYKVTAGFGHGGYHCFLFAAVGDGATAASIFTIYPPQWFLTGLHDQTDFDIFKKLGAS